MSPKVLDGLPSGISVDPLLGPFLIGTVVSAILFGILFLQVQVFMGRPDTPRALGSNGRLIPFVCLVLATFNLFAAIWSCYYFMVAHFGDSEGGIFGAVPWSFIANVVLTDISNSIVQSWFVWRIWHRSGKSIVLVVTLTLGIVATCAIVIALSIKAASMNILQDFSSIAWIFYLSLGFDAATNLGITVALSLYLSRRRRSPLYSWDYIISAPVVYMSHTGMICLIVIFMTFLMRLVRKDDYVFFGIFLPYSTLYANGLLGYMNSTRDDNWHASGRPSLPLQSRSTNISSGHAIHADMQRALDDAGDPSATIDMPLNVRVQKIVDKETMLL